MKWIYLAAAIFLVAAVVIVLAGERVWTALAGPADQGPVDFASLTLRDTPNQFLVCPPDKCAAPADRAAPVYEVTEQQLRELVISAWSAMPRTTLMAGSTEPSSGEIRFVQHSAILRFPDTISVHTWPAGEGRSTLAIYSRSLVGRSDLGANRDRIGRWLAALPVTPTD